MRLNTLGAVCGLAAFSLSSSAQTATAQGVLAYHKVMVASTNDEWTQTGFKINPGDLIVVITPGTIQLGGMAGNVNADGMSGSTDMRSGFLTAKIGTGASFRVGSRYVFSPDKAGQLKLRVADNNYSDNNGSFEVSVLHLPAASIPEPKVIEAE